MKNRILYILSFVMLFFVACSETGSEEFCNNPGAQCPDNSSIEATSCCTDQSCYWTYNGTKYTCDGEDCEAAINLIIANACAVSQYFDLDTNTGLENIRAQMQAVTNQLMEQARQASGCEF